MNEIAKTNNDFIDQARTIVLENDVLAYRLGTVDNVVWFYAGNEISVSVSVTGWNARIFFGHEASGKTTLGYVDIKLEQHNSRPTFDMLYESR